MLNRLIYNNEVYYKVKDLTELFEVSEYKLKKIIDECEIKTTTLKGYGRTKYILEQNVSDIIFEDGSTMYMKTSVQDYQEEFKNTVKIGALVGVFTGKEINYEEIREKINKKFEDTTKGTKSEAIEIKMNVFNENAERLGLTERVYKLDFIYGKETKAMYFRVDEKGNIIDDFNVALCYCEDEFKRNMQEGFLWNDKDEREYINIGKHKHLTVKELLDKFYKIIKNENNRSFESYDYFTYSTEKGYVSVDIDLLMKLLFGEVKVKGSNMFITEKECYEVEVDKFKQETIGIELKESETSSDYFIIGEKDNKDQIKSVSNDDDIEDLVEELSLEIEKEKKVKRKKHYHEGGSGLLSSIGYQESVNDTHCECEPLLFPC